MAVERSSPGGRSNGTAYRIHGQGEAVILIHGVGLDQHGWMRQVKDLARDHQVVTYDTLGHGDSALPPEQPCLADYAAQLLTLMNDLDLAAANIVGHSMGALVAIDFALRHPRRVRRLAALSAVFMRNQAQQQAIAERAAGLKTATAHPAIDATIARWFGQPVPTELQDCERSVRAALGRLNMTGYARAYGMFAAADQAHAGSLARLAVPALFMTGELDPNSTPTMCKAMAALVPGARLEIIENAGHMINMTHPARTNQVLSEFLATEVPAATATGWRS